MTYRYYVTDNHYIDKMFKQLTILIIVES